MDGWAAKPMRERIANMSKTTDVNKLGCLLSDAECELRLLSFALLQALQSVRFVDGEAGDSDAEYALDSEGISVVYGAEAATRNLCDRISKVLAECE